MTTASALAGIWLSSAGVIVTVPVGWVDFMGCSSGGTGRAPVGARRVVRSAAAGAGDAVLAAAVGADPLGVEVEDDLGDRGASDGDPGRAVVGVGLDLD